MKRNTAFRGDINALRGISVWLVLFYHFNVHIVDSGFIGVDIFFVISGLLMTKIVVGGLQAGRFSYLEFIVRRANRIIAPLYVMVLGVLVFGALFLPPIDLVSIGKQALSSLLFVSNRYFAERTGYFALGEDDRWLIHTWSLSVEWQFYMAYPLLVLLASYLVGNRRGMPLQSVGKLTLVLALLAVGSFAYCVLGDSRYSFFSVFARAWEMLAGGLVWLLASARADMAQPVRRRLAWGGLGLMLASMLLIHRFHLESRWPSWYALGPVLAAGLILLARDEDNRLFKMRWLQASGSASYSIYLWHMPLVILLSVTEMMTSYPRPAKVGGIAISLLLGYCSWRWIERRDLFSLKERGKSLLRLGVALLALVGFSAVADGSGGLLARVKQPAVHAALTEAQAADTYPPACENEAPGSKNLCRLKQGKPGGKLLVVGDSHAGHLYAWFVAHGERDTTFFVKSGCPMIPGFERSGRNRGCALYTSEVMKMVGSGDYDTVLLSQNWTAFGSVADDICTNIDGVCVTPATVAGQRLPLVRMREMINAMLQQGVQVVVLDATPVYLSYTPARLARALYWRDELDMRASGRAFIDMNAEYDKLFDELSGNDHFHRISLREQLCPNASCGFYDAGLQLPIYKDGSHFNPKWIVQKGDIFLPYATGMKLGRDGDGFGVGAVAAK